MVVGRVFGVLGCCEPDCDQVEEQRKGTEGFRAPVWVLKVGNVAQELPGTPNPMNVMFPVFAGARRHFVQQRLCRDGASSCGADVYLPMQRAITP